MSQTGVGEKRDLVLAPGEYAYLQDETRGQIKTHVGPTVINQTAQDRPVRFDPKTNSFQRCTLEQAVVKSPVASEGDYIILENPAQNQEKPEEGGSKASPPLHIGRKVNTPGPCTFALWPGQKATVVKGHHLRSNQYLFVRIYNEEQARQNWGQAVTVRATGPEAVPAASGSALTTTPAEALHLTIGKLMLIKGTEISFYIPPTGVEVEKDENGNYIREAVTLERLEYAILVDEDGNKRYEKGPQVVFPRPTETFYQEKGSRKFKAIELQPIQGLHVKVIADYQENGHEYHVGEEIFLTGREQSIYYPRVEHSIVQYGERKKHYATAIPAGEGRYVMNRSSGEIKTVRGPQMLLPDPRHEVIVRRVLSDKECALWYPGNQEALAYNRSLRAVMNEAPSARAGFVPENELLQRQAEGLREAPTASQAAEKADTGKAAMPDSFERNLNYTQPRTVTLDTKYQGVPSINVWTGYAAMVISKTGTRRVEKGPCTILLEYDESLEVLELSTGKPKSTDRLERTVFLRVMNNKVSDIIHVKTRDRVEVSLKLSYRVNFEGEESRWFQVENYVQFLCDHIRSLLKGAAQKRTVAEFEANGVDLVRDVILGPVVGSHRPGLTFEENGMHVTDVEVLEIEVDDPSIAEMLTQVQHEVVRANIQLDQAEKELAFTRRREEIARESEEARAATVRRKNELMVTQVGDELTLALARLQSDLEVAGREKEAEKARQLIEDLKQSAALQRQSAASEQELTTSRARLQLVLDQLRGETEAVVQRFQSAQGGFSEALVTLGNQETLQKVAEALSVQNIIGGKNFVEVLGKLFGDSPLQGVFNRLTERSNSSH